MHLPDAASHRQRKGYFCGPGLTPWTLLLSFLPGTSHDKVHNNAIENAVAAMTVSQSNERAERDGSAFKSIEIARELAF